MLGDDGCRAVLVSRRVRAGEPSRPHRGAPSDDLAGRGSSSGGRAPPGRPPVRVVVVTSDVPFVEGGHRIIARALTRALQAAGHEAEIVTTPQNRFGRQVSAYLATRLTDVEVAGDGRPIDRVVSLRFPSYAVRHPHHVSWLNHRMREYYDLWQGFRQELPLRGKMVESVRRRLLHALDRHYLRRVRHVFAQSETIRRRLERWGGIPAEVLYPPPPPRPYRCDGHVGPVLAVSRLVPLKRMDLLVRAVARSDGLRARLAGTGPELGHLRELARDLEVDSRIEFIGQLSGEELVAEYAGCSVVLFPPRAEDYGMVTLEAFASSKAVVTCSDSGGPTELVDDGVTGYVVEPTAEAVGVALERVAADPAHAEELGKAARRVAGRHTWPSVVERLLSA